MTAPHTAATYSIDQFLLRGTLWALGLGLLISSVMSYIATRHEVAELFDAQLIENTRVLKGFINHPARSEDWVRLQLSLQEAVSTTESAGSVLSQHHAYEKKLAVQVWSADAKLVVHSPSAPRYALATLQAGLTVFHDQHHDWQVYTVWLEQNQHWLVVAERQDIRTELSRNILASVLFGVLFGFAVAVWRLRHQLHLGLAPLRQLGHAIQQRSAHDLTLIQLPHTPAELTPVVNELNLLLHRVDAALVRERRFLADAAHELRTPLAVILLQVQQAIGLPAAQQHAVLCKLLSSVQRNQQVVEQLLLLARLESDHAEFQPTVLRLDEVVREVIAQLLPLAFKRDIDIECDAEVVYLPAESALMVALVRNVLDNAIRHSPAHSVIAVTLTQNVEYAELCLIDQGGGIDCSQVGAMMQRFGQSDRADRGGAGLGLAIAQTITARHSGRLILQNEHDPTGAITGLRVSIALPLVLRSVLGDSA
jgi:two-component system sensor histidine kinase QseC